MRRKSTGAIESIEQRDSIEVIEIRKPIGMIGFLKTEAGTEETGPGNGRAQREKEVVSHTVTRSHEKLLRSLMGVGKSLGLAFQEVISMSPSFHTRWAGRV